MKNILLITLTILAVLAVTTQSQSHNVTWGVVSRFDTLLHHEIVQVPSKFLRKTSTEFEYPKKGQWNYRIITGIQVVDQYINGDGGYAFITKGGVGFKNVTLKFKSQRGKGINFVVSIFTH